ncbi:hypothetical protein [Stetteria hydrogenophila]
MLKLTLTPGDVDRVLDAAAKAYVRVLDNALKGGVLRIYFYPDPDSMVAAAYTASHAYYSGARPSLKASLKPPARVAVPTVLLGFNTLQLKASDVEATVLAVASGSLQGTPPPDAFFLEAEGSVSASMLLVTSRAGPRPPLSVAALAFAGLYGGRYVAPHGAFAGLDKHLLDHAEDLLGLKPVMTTTVKVYKPSEGTLCEAIARTVNPYYPGLTGDPEACREALGDPGLYNKKASALEKGEITKSLDSILNRVESIVGEVDPRLYIGGILEFSDVAPRDPREALDALIHAAEAAGDQSVPLAALLDPELEYRPLEAALEEYAKELAEGPPKARRLKGPGWLRIYAVDEPHTPSLAWRALRVAKRVEEDAVIAIHLPSDEYVASPFQVEGALGPGGARRLVETRVASMQGLWLKLQLSQQQ